MKKRKCWMEGCVLAAGHSTQHDSRRRWPKWLRDQLNAESNARAKAWAEEAAFVARVRAAADAEGERVRQALGLPDHVEVIYGPGIHAPRRRDERA